MQVFSHPERNSFFRKMGLPWYNVAAIDELSGLPITSEQQPYGMYHCQQVEPAMVEQMLSTGQKLEKCGEKRVS